MIHEMKFSNKLEYGFVGALGLLGGALAGSFLASYFDSLGYSDYAQITGFVGVIVLCTVLSVLLKHLLLRHKHKNNITVMGQQGTEYYMPLSAYAFPIPDGLEKTCVIQFDYVPSVVDKKIKIGSGVGWVEVEPKQLAEFDLEPGQRYYIAADLESEAKAVVRDSSRGWWPYRIVG